MVLDTGWRCDRELMILSGGESLPEKILPLLRDRFSNSRIFNMYGPTETTVWSSMAELTDGKCHLGRPIANTQLYNLDVNRSLVPKGSVGELYIGGSGLARGYLNQPDLTAEKFVVHPLSAPKIFTSTSLLYRTGDLVRYSDDGCLEYIGRIDDQVKIRGFRVELGEIESQIARLEGVDSALVVVKKQGNNEQLVGYINPTNEISEDNLATFISEVKVGLSAHLPEYMVPKALIVINEWPLTPNGKVDRKALPEPDGSTLHGKYTAPQTDTEKALVDIWSKLLGIDADKISTTANFFESGGHSLLIVRLMTMVQQQFGLKLTMKNIIEAKALVDLAHICEREVRKSSLKKELREMAEQDLEEVEF
jgi:acyl carrier protein